jgi:hypothetical protein
LLHRNKTASGLSTQIGDLPQRIGGGNAQVALAVIFRVLLTSIISNATAATIMFPIVMSSVSFNPSRCESCRRP